ncbi:MAG: DUF2235 domain-containing protein [Gammaproteobacteria bacterium]
MGEGSKRIVLCSDGTGNQGGVGEDSNVYKLYSAVELRHADLEQLKFYDNGVGTNNNKIIRAVSGAFGFGFGRNVRDLYEFLAKHYRPGDEVYFFGFSRGAATVRAVTGFIDACGLVDLDMFPEVKGDPIGTDLLIWDIFRLYERRLSNPEKAAEFKKNKAIHHPEFAPDGNLRIKFLGVWDTVSALGFPQDWSIVVEKFFALADRLSDYVFPHLFYNYRLNDSIEFAYQALSIDDERETFKPRLWRHGRGRTVEQVWFAGVHANVGGGYPRTGLSNVALQWMMTKARGAGLVFQADAFKQVCEQAHELGRLYDSRSGLGAYYRYKPRDIKELAAEMDIETVKFHDTVFHRIDHGIAGYAPGNMPENIEIVTTEPPSAEKRKDIAARLKRIKKHNPERMKILEGANKFIGFRRNLYRVMVESTLILLIAAYALGPVEIPSDASVASVALSNALNFLLPDFFKNLVNYLVLRPFHLFLLVSYFAFLFYLRIYFHNEMDKIHAKARRLLL